MRRIYFFILLIVISCGAPDNKFQIKNQLEGDIYYAITYSNLNSEMDFGSPIYNDNQFIKAGETAKVSAIRKDWEGVFELTERINVFIFDAQIIKNQPWEQVRTKKKFLRHYILTLEDLERTSWLLVVK